MLIAICLVCGCGHASTADAPQVNPDPAEALHERAHAGAFQLNEVVESLIKLKDFTRGIESKADSAEKRKLVAIDSLVDRAGEIIGDYPTEPPALAQFKEDLPKQQNHASDAARAGKTALAKLVLAGQIVDTLKLPVDQIDKLRSALLSAIDGLNGAIASFSG